jgi:hypothetical protein
MPGTYVDTFALPLGNAGSIASQWRRVQTTQLRDVTKGLVDSVITVRRLPPDETDIVYTFDNACQDTVEAFALRDADTLLVRFRPRITRQGNATLPEVALCPTWIKMEAFSARVVNSSANIARVRAFVGNDTSWKQIRQYDVKRLHYAR